MNLIDLTMEIPGPGQSEAAATLEEWPIAHGETAYTGMVYRFNHDSMAGTYIDFPGHIKETDDGRHAASYPPENLYRIPATVIHLDREDESGGVSAKELKDGCGGALRGALAINALGEKRFDQIIPRSVWLTDEAVDWIVSGGVKFLVSDIYESRDLHGVFFKLFRAGIATVCRPVNLHLLPSDGVRLTALTPRFENVTQLPCRLLGEFD